MTDDGGGDIRLAQAEIDRLNGEVSRLRTERDAFLAYGAMLELRHHRTSGNAANAVAYVRRQAFLDCKEASRIGWSGWLVKILADCRSAVLHAPGPDP
jgi:voltage-gated potassium channel Kch